MGLYEERKKWADSLLDYLEAEELTEALEEDLAQTDEDLESFHGCLVDDGEEALENGFVFYFEGELSTAITGVDWGVIFKDYIEEM